MKPKRVIIIGCGGTGSMLALPLCRYIYSLRNEYVPEIFFADGDSYSESNMERQNFNPLFLNKNKAEYQATVISANLPTITEKVNYIDEYLSQTDLENLICENCVVFNCSDDKAIRKFVEDKCLKLNNSAHICCGNESKTGQVQVSFRQEGKQITPSIYAKHPEFNSLDGDRSTMNCEQLAALPSGGQIICANMMAAALALNYYYQITSDMLVNINKGNLTSSGVRFNTMLHNFEVYDESELNVA